VSLAVCLLAPISLAANINGNGTSLNLSTSDYWSGDSQRNADNASLVSAGTPDGGVVSVNGQGAKVIIDPLDALAGSGPTQANFTADPILGKPPLEVHFTDQSTSGLYEMVSWSWDFGDGHSSTDQNPVHVYDNAGSYSVTLTITTSGGNASTTKTDLIVVSEAVPAVGTTGIAALVALITISGVLRTRKK
jgi:PKD repeat protein